jgi:hypothetical protein
MLETCPRCKGRGWELKGKPTPTLRVDNVMGSTQTIYYKCSKCCYTEKRPYGDDDKSKKKRDEQEKLS